MSACTAAWNQKAFRGRNDDGDETTATWKAAQNTNWTQAVDENFRVRFEVQETAACAGNNKTWQLQYNLNAAGWVNVTATSTVVRSSASPNLADAANLTNQLTVGTGTFQGATGFDEVNGAAGGASMDVAASGHAEAEFCVQILSADVVNNDTVQLRITDNGTAFAAYDATPSITVSEVTHYSLNAEPGSYSVTGVAAGTLAGRALDASPGSYALTGFDAGLAHGYQLNAEPGSYSISGVAAGLLADHLINAEPGSYSLTGVAAGALAGRSLNAEPGSYLISGVDATLAYGGGGPGGGYDQRMSRDSRRR